MSTRQRMTWAALDREAAAPPAIPGYGVEDQDHPAHTQDDPGADDYQIGDTSSFGEDVHQPPYGDSGPPALPGYGVEDQDHPAHSGQVGRQASLMELVRRKSAKALTLARATLGKTASWDAVEDQAFDYMRSMDDSALDASIERLGGDFLAMDEFMDEDDEMLAMEDEHMGMDPMEARLKAMEDELMALRMAAGQNDPDGETLGAKGKSEDEVKEEEAASKEAAPVLAMFDAYDTDGDGFVVAEEWGGPRAMFASMDFDNDGIIARHDVLAACKMAGEDEEESEDEEGSDKEASDASKVAFGHYADFDEDELEMLRAMEMDDLDMMDEDGMGVMAAKKGEDEEESEESEESEDEGSDKEASEADFFAMGHDPMGLSDGEGISAEDEAMFAEAFGLTASEDEGEEEEDEGTGKEASLDQLLNPQPKKASTGVRSVGSVRQSKKASSEMDELSSLWASKPDVSSAFG